MAYVPVPNDLSRIKTKLAFNLTKRQLICFSIAGGIGIPFYLFTRSHIGNSTALFLMIGLMMPCFKRTAFPLRRCSATLSEPSFCCHGSGPTRPKISMLF